MRAVVGAETDFIVNDLTSGLLHVSDTLSRPVGDHAPLDALQQAFDDLRVGPAFATADLVAMHPSTWAHCGRKICRIAIYSAPNPSTGQVDTIWGRRVVVNTRIEQGAAIVFDTSQACWRGRERV